MYSQKYVVFGVIGCPELPALTLPSSMVELSHQNRSPPKSGPPGPIFAEKWSPGPILAAKIGLPGLIMAAKIGPP